MFDRMPFCHEVAWFWSIYQFQRNLHANYLYWFFTNFAWFKFCTLYMYYLAWPKYKVCFHFWLQNITPWYLSYLIELWPDLDPWILIWSHIQPKWIILFWRWHRQGKMAGWEELLKDRHKIYDIEVAIHVDKIETCSYWKTIAQAIYESVRQGDIPRNLHKL